MTEYISLYEDDAGSIGDEISEYGVTTNPAGFTLRIDLEETDTQALWVVAETGYKVSSTVITVSGLTMDRWALSEDDTTYYASGISIGTVYASGLQIYIEAEATADDVVEKDYSVSINIEGIAEAV